MSEQREPSEWLQVPVPRSLCRDLAGTVARDMGYPSAEAVYRSDNGDDALFNLKFNQAVMEALRQWLAGKAVTM